MARPTAGVGNFEYRPTPSRQAHRPPHVILYRPQQGHNGNRLKPADTPGKRRLTGQTGRSPRWWVKMIHRVSARINQVAARVLKNRQEPFVRDRRIDSAKRISNCPVQPGISLIEEPPRSRRGLSNEQQPNHNWAVSPPKPFSVRFHVSVPSETAGSFARSAACSSKGRYRFPYIPVH
jgi:hypothetical protein